MSKTTVTETDQYLTFTLADEHYAIAVSQVKEVLEIQPITRIPRTPPYMRGVINVRGGVVPILDLRRKFGLEETEDTVDTAIIVLELWLENETVILGAIADSVQEVIKLSEEQIEPPPKIGTKLDTEFINGLGKYDEQFLIILDIQQIFSKEELLSAQEAQLPENVEEH